MRRLNLLRQLLFGDTIGALDEWAPSTRHIFAVLNMINSRRGWQDVLVISNRDLLSAAGYKQSRYANGLIKTFQTEATESGAIEIDISSGVTTYLIKSLSQADISAAKDRHAPKRAAKIPPKLAASLAKEREAERQINVGGSSNIGKAGNNRNGGRTGKVIDLESGGGGSNGGGDGDGTADDIIRQLADLGL